MNVQDIKQVPVAGQPDQQATPTIEGKKSSKKWLWIIVVVILVLVSIFIIFKILRDPDRILDRSQKTHNDLSLQPITNLKFPTSYKEVSGVFIGNNFQGSITASPQLSKSTVTLLGKFPVNIIIAEENDVSVQDRYDGVYHLLKDGVTLTTSDLNYFKWHVNTIFNLLKNAENKSLKTKGDLQVITAEITDPLIKSLRGQETASVELYIDRTSDLPISFLIRSIKHPHIILLTGSFSINPDQTLTKIDKPTNRTIFGDFIARESIYLRTDDLGSHDYLWPRWEKYFFDCEKCINRYGDKDKDGLINLLEFIYGSNPNKKDSDDDGVNDYREIANKSLPHFYPKKSVMNAEYAKATRFLIVDYLKSAKLGIDNTAPVKNATLRDGVVEIDHVYIPNSASKLVITYVFEGNPDNTAYFTIFLDDELIYTALPIAGHKISRSITEKLNPAYIRKESADIKHLRNKIGKLYIIINSFGRPGGSYVLSGLKIKTDKGLFFSIIPGL